MSKASEEAEKHMLRLYSSGVETKIIKNLLTELSQKERQLTDVEATLEISRGENTIAFGSGFRAGLDRGRESMMNKLDKYQKVVDAAQKYKEANAMYNYSGKREAKDALYKTLSQIKETNDE